MQPNLSQPQGTHYHTEVPSKLLEYLNRAASLDAEFIVFDDGYRGWTYRYTDIAQMANALRRRLRAAGIGKGDAVAIWSESRAGWVAALWACLMDGVIVVPVDPQSSPALFERIAAKAGAKVTLLGERVPSVEGAWKLSEIENQRASPPDGVAVETDDIAEIVFTSGTTAEPKGVVITHRNLLANLEPVAGEIAKYRKYAGPFRPLRILNLLPLSHLFGQSLALHMPPLIPASVVFISTTGAHEVARQIRMRKISAVVAVPKILEVLRDLAVRDFPEVAHVGQDPGKARGKWYVRWWRFRRVHRLFGWKFWCFISGGAPLAADVEKFWSRLGYLVVQGYGLTETAPIVTLSHPFHVREGTVGKPLSGVELRIADDGEVLVRGENVTKGYFQSPGETATAFEDGWFHTGDIGELDSQGHLRIRGRKKEMIVTPEGLKVFPEDVEKILNVIPGVRESAVIGTERVHAVLMLDPNASAEEIVRLANQRLEDQQKIRSFSIWPGDQLPRTQSTRKLRRAEIADTIRKGPQAAPPKPENELAALLQKYAPGRTITPETTLDELGLSSLDRVQLMMELEQRRSADVDESAFSSATTVADLARPAPARAEPIQFPTYNQSLVARAARRLALPYFLLPLARIFAHIRVSGVEHLVTLDRPVIFASNHQSHFDVPVILASLPARLRYRVATAMSKEFFDPHFYPALFSRRERFTNSLYYRLATFFFAAFPIPQRHAGAGQTIRYMGDLIDRGWSILIFPEGDRTSTGEIQPFQPGVGMIASRLYTAVVPVRLVGLDRVLHRSAKWPEMGRVEVKFGAPVSLAGDDFAGLAARVEAEVRRL